MRFLKKILVLLLIISTLFSVISCGEKDNDKDNNGTNDFSNCTVTVKNPLGKPIPGVTVYLHLDGGADYNICATPVTTNADGKVSFNLNSSDSYSVGLSGYPMAYTAKSGLNRSERYALDSENVEITLDLSDGSKIPKTYSLGDHMVNFTISDVNGEEYELYDILSSKRAVVLNFWFCGCGPCKSEFPALNTAYNTYKNDIEILAINDYSSSSEDVASIKSFGNTSNLDMPLFKTQSGSAVSISRFATVGYPTTVIIDRYGVISFIHSGAITSISVWEEIFDYYTSNNYNGTPYN